MDPILAHRGSFSADNNNGPPPVKRFKGSPEVPASYSDAVRKKLASTTRTGQACDRCKERKMKCDTNPTACLPCRQKNIRCLTTDRVTGRASERGQSERLEGELQQLRRHLTTYHQKYGPLEDRDTTGDDYSSVVESYANHTQSRQPPCRSDQFECTSPSYDGSEQLYAGPIMGTVVDLIGDVLDIANFPCPEMEDYDKNQLNIFNVSKTSVINTICGAQSISDPQLPNRDEVFKNVNHFLTYIWPYMPIVHRSSFLEMTKKYYQNRSSITVAEEVQIVVVLAIIAHQSAVRNPPAADKKMEESNRWLHYALSRYGDLCQDTSIASMQAMTLILTHFRNLPKPGHSWIFSHTVLMKAIDLDYHRSPNKIKLPEAEDNPLAKELRKRIFWSILGICVSIGTKVGKPAPWPFQHIDTPFPMAIQDHEISVEGLAAQRSGRCDFWIALRLFRLLPILTELYNDVISVRRPANEYIPCVEALDAKITAWRKGWDQDVAVEENGEDIAAADSIRVATLHIEIWAAETQLVLHHPKLDTSAQIDFNERNLETCHACSKRLLQAFRTLSQKHRGADFTWHTTVAYALAFGAVLHIYDRRKYRASPEQFEPMRTELREWLVVMCVADKVMKTNSHLIRCFDSRVQKLEGEYQIILGRSLEIYGQQHPQQPKVESPSQVSSTASTQQRRYSTGPGMEYSNHHHNSNSTPSAYVPDSTYGHPPLLPDGYNQTPNPYSRYPPASYSQQIQYTRAPASTSLAPLLNETTPAYAPYPTPQPAVLSPQQQHVEAMLGLGALSSRAEVYPDYTDERQYWPRSIHPNAYQGPWYTS